MQKVEICGVNTSTLPKLTEGEQSTLLRQIKNGDKSARSRFIYGNLRLVLSVMKRFSSCNENMDDLFQIGCIGLMKAIDNFDIGLNVRFSTYAVPMIMGEIPRFMRDNSPLRVSRSLKDTAYKALSMREYLTKKNSAEPTIADIAKELEISKEELVYALDAIQNPMSLYDPVYSEGGDTLYIMDQVFDKKNLEEHWVEQISLANAISFLDERESEIVNLRFFEGKTQTEVASQIGISQAQVSRLEKEALKVLYCHMH